MCLGCKRTRNVDLSLHILESPHTLGSTGGSKRDQQAAWHPPRQPGRVSPAIKTMESLHPGKPGEGRVSSSRDDSPCLTLTHHHQIKCTGRLEGSRVRSTTRQGLVQTRTGKVYRKIPGSEAKFMCKGVADLSLLSHFLTLIPTK